MVDSVKAAQGAQANKQQQKPKAEMLKVKVGYGETLKNLFKKLGIQDSEATRKAFMQANPKAFTKHEKCDGKNDLVLRIGEYNIPTNSKNIKDKIDAHNKKVDLAKEKAKYKDAVTSDKFIDKLIDTQCVQRAKGYGPATVDAMKDRLIKFAKEYFNEDVKKEDLNDPAKLNELFDRVQAKRAESAAEPNKPVNPDGDKPPVNNDGDIPPVNNDGDKPPVNNDGDKPPVNNDGDKPPVNNDGDKPPVEPGKSELDQKIEQAQTEEDFLALIKDAKNQEELDKITNGAIAKKLGDNINIQKAIGEKKTELATKPDGAEEAEQVVPQLFDKAAKMAELARLEKEGTSAEVINLQIGAEETKQKVLADAQKIDIAGVKAGIEAVKDQKPVPIADGKTTADIVDAQKESDTHAVAASQLTEEQKTTLDGQLAALKEMDLNALCSEFGLNVDPSVLEPLGENATPEQIAKQRQAVDKLVKDIETAMGKMDKAIKDSTNVLGTNNTIIGNQKAIIQETEDNAAALEGNLTEADKKRNQKSIADANATMSTAQQGNITAFTRIAKAECAKAAVQPLLDKLKGIQPALQQSDDALTDIKAFNEKAEESKAKLAKAEDQAVKDAQRDLKTAGKKIRVSNRRTRKKNDKIDDHSSDDGSTKRSDQNSAVKDAQSKTTSKLEASRNARKALDKKQDIVKARKAAQEKLDNMRAPKEAEETTEVQDDPNKNKPEEAK